MGEPGTDAFLSGRSLLDFVRLGAYLLCQILDHVEYFASIPSRVVVLKGRNVAIELHLVRLGLHGALF